MAVWIAGCTFVNNYREVPGDGAGGGGASDGGGGGTTGTGGGAGGSKCSPADCDDENPCTTDACDPATGKCQHLPVSEPDPSVQTAGDCLVIACQSGKVAWKPDDDDLPADDNDCTEDLCKDGVASNPPRPLGTPCQSPDDPAATVCDGAGSCVQCNAPSDCPGASQDGECQTTTCMAGVCGKDLAPADTPLSLQTPGDCQLGVCDGLGAAKQNPDDSDLPDDNNDCTSDACNMGKASVTKAPINTPCGAQGTLYCDGDGKCVGCNEDAQCQADTFCRDWSCDSMTKTCKSNDTPNNTPLPPNQQTPGDCQEKRCDGAGNVKSANITDPNNDGNQCTKDLCNGGVPSNPAEPVDTACNQNGGVFCNGNPLSPACVACTKNSHCNSPDVCAPSGSCAPCTAQVALGGEHACARKSDGTLWCWGHNNYGQLGDATVVDKKTPVQVSALGNTVVDVALGGAHSCARKQDGTLWCWGNADYGRLGDGTPGGIKAAPVQAMALGAGVVEVALGGAHTCAHKQDGTLWCVGYNNLGQLGDGMQVNNPIPVQVMALGNSVAGVDLGGYHSCARKQDGTLWCWGRNSEGNLGGGNIMNPQLSPQPLAVLGSSAIALAVGGFHGCARKQDSTIWCWGGGTQGQLGIGGGDKSSPTEVTALASSTVAVELGGYHSCARKQDASLWCWGDNENGAVGVGTAPTDEVYPVKVATLGSAVTGFSLGTGFTCAIKQAGTLWCWGLNLYGQLGDDSTMDKSIPVKSALCP